jgi:hypothetical protein
MKHTLKSPDGTSFHDSTIHTSVEQLKQILGTPYSVNNDGLDKVNFEWIMETDNGEVFTVYDWKKYRPISETEEIEWHIGGYGKSITEQAKREIKTALNKKT